MIIEGKNILVYIYSTDDFYPFGCDKSCTLSIQSTFIRMTDPLYSKITRRLPVDVDWSITGNGLIDYSRLISGLYAQNAVLAGTRVQVKFSAQQSDTEACVYSGYGYFESVAETGAVDGAASYSYNIVGDGELTVVNTIPLGQYTVTLSLTEDGSYEIPEGNTIYKIEVTPGADTNFAIKDVSDNDLLPAIFIPSGYKETINILIAAEDVPDIYFSEIVATTVIKIYLKKT